MADINGFILQRKSNDAEVARWKSVPPRIDLPGGDVVFDAATGWQNDSYRIIAHVWQTDPDDDSEAMRRTTIKNAADRIDMLNRMRATTSAQMDTFVDNQIDGATVDQLRAQCRAMFKRLIKAIALDSRD